MNGDYITCTRSSVFAVLFLVSACILVNVKNADTRSLSLFPYVNKIIALPAEGYLKRVMTVYPETKGVPLEEMDAVFGEGVRILPLNHSSHLKTELNHSTFIEPFREHLPLGSSLEMSPVLAQCVYPPRPHTSSGRIGTNRSGEENSSWLSQMMGRKSRSKSGKNGEGSSYKLLSRGEDGDEDEIHRFRTDVDTHVIGDNEDTEGSEELEVVHARRSNSGGLHRSR